MAQISWPAVPSVRIPVVVPDPPIMSSLDGLESAAQMKRIQDYVARAGDWMQRAKEQIEVLSDGNAELQDFLEHLLDAVRPLQLVGGDLIIATDSGSPEGVVTANIGSVYLRNDGGAVTTLYIKTSGTGSTGWTAK